MASETQELIEILSSKTETDLNLEDMDEEEVHTQMDYDTENCTLIYQPKPETPPSEVTLKDDNMEGVLLEPDHPLLARFQATLRDQLQKQLNRLTEEVSEFEIGIKKKSAEREELGVVVYDVQQMVSVQYDSLDQYEKDIQKFLTDRNEIEKELIEITETYNKTKDILNEAEKKENSLGQEMQTMNFMYHQVEEWEKKLESDLAVNQRISDKSKFEKKQVTEEKRNLDFLIYKLMTEVFRLENNLEHLSMQLRVQEEEREKLGTQIADSNTDIELLESEQKRLMHSWNSALVAVGHRDKLFGIAKDELGKEQEDLQNVLLQITVMKKMSNEEMQRNEQLTLYKGRLDIDRANLNAKLNHEINTISNLERKICQTQAMLQQTNKDLEETTVERKVKEQAITDIIREIEKHTFTKLDLEDQILFQLQEQITNDKVSKYMNKSVRSLREVNRNLEISLASAENKHADISVRIEHQRNVNNELNRRYDELEAEETVKKNEVINVNNEIAKYVAMNQRNGFKQDEMQKKYDEMIKNMGGVEMTPTEIKIKDLEKTIQEYDEKNTKLKLFWLRQESYILSLKEDRQKQLNEMNLIRKQIMLLQQKNLRLEDELEEIERSEKKFERSMTNLKYQIDKLNTEVWKKRGQKEHLDVMNLSHKMDFLQKLKDEEMSCLKLEDKLAELEEEKDQLANELAEANREAWSWDRKAKLALETKQTIQKEKSAEGETGVMKAEIHRMTVRLSQLRKMQEKMIHDLNHCVSRREFIYINAEATEKHLSGSKNNKFQNQSTVQRKLEDTKNKLKKAQNEGKILEKKISQSFELENELFKKISDSEGMIEDINNKISFCKNNIAIAKLDRQKELEILVFNQHKLHAFSSISRNIYRPRFKHDQCLENEFIVQNDKNKKLQSIVENLVLEYPNYYPDFMKILNTLRVIQTN